MLFDDRNHFHYWYTLGLVKDEYSLRDLKIATGAKMMVVGSTIDDVITVQAPSGSVSDSDTSTLSSGMYVLTSPSDHSPYM